MVRPRGGDGVAKAGLYLATFMAVFDIAVVYLALPAIERSLGAGIAEQQWVASSYGLMEAGFTLAAGTLGDLWGRRRIYVAGLLLFTLASIASGLASTPGTLIAARFVQGIGGAIIMALPLAILVSFERNEAESARSIRTFATIAGLGAVCAPTFGGLLVQTIGWRAIFFVNVPVSLFVLYAALTRTSESALDSSKRLDLTGQITSIAALVALSFAAIEGAVLGWTSVPIVGAAVLALAAASAFVVNERRTRDPMLPFALLRAPLLASGAFNMLAMNVGFFTIYLTTSLFLQNVKRVDPLVAGSVLLANNLGFFLMSEFGAPLVDRLGAKRAIVMGVGGGAAGLLVMTAFDAATPAWLVAVPLALTGLVWGLALTPLNSRAMNGIPASDEGLAAGLLSLGRPLGAVIGTAVFGSIIATRMHASLDHALRGLDVSAATAARVEIALHHGGLWALSGTAAAYGFAPGTFAGALDGGFLVGMRASLILAALVSAVGVWFALRAQPAATPTENGAARET